MTVLRNGYSRLRLISSELKKFRVFGIVVANPIRFSQ